MCTISDFRELNKRIVRKPYPIPKISKILQELEGFTYATALDPNMGYYTIRKTLDLGGEGGKLLGATKCAQCEMRNEKLSSNW